MKSRAQILAEAYEGNGVDYSDIWDKADPDWKRRWEAVAEVDANTPLFRVDAETGEICVVAKTWPYRFQQTASPKLDVICCTRHGIMGGENWIDHDPRCDGKCQERKSVNDQAA